MLQVIRHKAQGIVAWTIVVLITIIFALLGLNEFFTARNSSSVAAKVNGNKIYWSTVNSIYQNVYKQYASHPDFNIEDLNPVLIKQQILNSLIRQTVMLNYLQSGGYIVSKEQLIAVLQSVPAFQKDGAFSPNLYHTVLQANSLTDRAYQNNLKNEILIGQLQQSVSSSSFSTSIETKEIVNLLNQKRDFGYTILSKAKFAKDVSVSSAEILNYYNEHKQDFMSLQKVQIAYIELGLNNVINDVETNDEALKKYYDDNIVLYSTKPEVKLSHILISAPKATSSSDTLNKAQAKAETVLKKLKTTTNNNHTNANTNSKEFALLATQYSDDKPSATKGGDLGWISGGGNVDPEIIKAAFSLDINEISNIVQTDYGFHILKVTNKKPATVKSFEQVKNTVKNQYKKEQGEKLLSDRAEELANLAFEYPDDLAAVAKSMGLELKESEPFSKDGSTKGIGSIKKVIDAAFSEDLLSQDKNSDIIKISEDSFAVIRDTKIIPPSQLEFDDVKDKIKNLLIAKKTEDVLKQASEKIITALKENKKETATGLEWKTVDNAVRGYDKADPKIMREVFRLPNPALNLNAAVKLSIAGIQLPNGDYAIVELKKVHPGKLDLQRDIIGNKANAKNEIANGSGDAENKQQLKDLEAAYAKHVEVTMGRYEYNLYEDAIYNSAKIKVNEMPN